MAGYKRVDEDKEKSRLSSGTEKMRNCFIFLSLCLLSGEHFLQLLAIRTLSKCLDTQSVRFKDLLTDPYVDLTYLTKSCGDLCGIVYCLERTTCDDLASHLSTNGISCAAYHSGLNNKLRTSVLDDWIFAKTQVVMAIVAFSISDAF